MAQPSSNSVTQWLQMLREGKSEAAEQLWNRYFARLVDQARRQLGMHQRRMEDEEDIALSVFDTLVRGAAKGGFPLLHDRRDLWCLLLAITRQKVAGYKRREGRQKRGGGRVIGEEQMRSWGSQVGMTLDDLCGNDPSPEFLAALDEEHRFLLGLLRSASLRSIAVKTLEGYSTEEIAGELKVSRRTVLRKLALIRETWARVLLTG